MFLRRPCACAAVGTGQGRGGVLRGGFMGRSRSRTKNSDRREAGRLMAYGDMK
jgi:hypothetical protein